MEKFIGEITFLLLWLLNAVGYFAGDTKDDYYSAMGIFCLAVYHILRQIRISKLQKEKTVSKDTKLRFKTANGNGLQIYESEWKSQTKELKKKMNDLAERFCAEEPGYYDELIKETLKSD